MVAALPWNENQDTPFSIGIIIMELFLEAVLKSLWCTVLTQLDVWTYKCLMIFILISSAVTPSYPEDCKFYCKRAQQGN